MKANLTVLSCFYNRNHYIDAVLKTIDEQTLRPAEIIVVDDGSEPPLQVPKRDDITLIRLDKNGGLAHAQNIGVEAASQPFIAKIDSDDTWEPTKLEKQYNLLLKCEKNIFGIFVNYMRHGREKAEGINIRQGITKTPNVNDWYSFFLKGVRCGGSTIMFRKEAFLNVGKIDTSLLRYEDWDYWLRATESGYYKFKTIDETLAAALLSGRPDATKALSALDIIEKRHLPLIKNPNQRRIFNAALAFERAACYKWQGRRGRMCLNLLKCLRSPELVMRELELSLRRS